MSENKIDRKLIAELAAGEEKRLEESTPKSYELFKRAKENPDTKPPTRDIDL